MRMEFLLYEEAGRLTSLFGFWGKNSVLVSMGESFWRCSSGVGHGFS